MYLFILESIGMSELIMIGIVALVIFGPRKLPGIARTVGKTIADLKRTTDEFKETWERESSMTEVHNEMKDFSNELSKIKQISTEKSFEKDIIDVSPKKEITLPSVKQIEIKPVTVEPNKTNPNSTQSDNLTSEKQSWL